MPSLTRESELWKSTLSSPHLFPYRRKRGLAGNEHKEAVVNGLHAQCWPPFRKLPATKCSARLSASWANNRSSWLVVSKHRMHPISLFFNKHLYAALAPKKSQRLKSPWRLAANRSSQWHGDCLGHQVVSWQIISKVVIACQLFTFSSIHRAHVLRFKGIL